MNKKKQQTKQKQNALATAEAAAEEEAAAKGDKKREKEKQKVHVCMYVLFIPSFPNNRFHLGNIRNNTLSKQERKEIKKEEEQKEAEV